MSDMEQYSSYFPAGMKISVGIPMETNELFRDWAIVHELEENIVNLQLSRDDLPIEVHLNQESILDLRGGREGQGYRCSGFFVSHGEAGKILVHLTGDVVPSELREFYRIDVFLPFRYQFSKDQQLDSVLAEWRLKRQTRLSDELDRKETFLAKRRDRVFRVASGNSGAENNEQEKSPEQETEEFYPIDDTWNTVNATAINLSAGGFKFATTEHFEMDDLVFFELLIPTVPPRIMDTVARVVLVQDGKEYFNVAIQFMLIEERDRDAVVSHISTLETLRIRQLRQLPLLDSISSKSRISPLKMFFGIAALLLLTVLIFSYFYGYTQKKGNNEIQDTFQKSVKKYIEKKSR